MQNSILGTAAIAMVLSTFAAPSLAKQGSAPELPSNYACDDGTLLQVSYFTIRGHKAVEIEFPTGRDKGARIKRLLPATQTGSGERYASDITEFHVKGDQAHFATLASAQSEAIARLDCKRWWTDAEIGSVTQPARAGKYFIIHPSGPGYNQFETICFAEDGQNYLGVNAGSKPGEARTNNGRSSKTVNVGPVDAGVGQRRYTLSARGPSSETATLHFTAPGMREAHLPSATSGLTSISQGGGQLGCVDNDRVVFVGTTGGQGIVITVEDDGLVLQAYGDSDDTVWPTIRNGYVTHGDDRSVFEFLDGEKRVRIMANRDGFRFIDSSTGDWINAWSLETPIAQRSTNPAAYFIADKAVFGADLPSLDQTTQQLLTALSFCSHLAGEASEDAERNADLSQKWEAAKCDTVDEAYPKAVRSAETGGPLHTYLTLNSPSWM